MNQRRIFVIDDTCRGQSGGTAFTLQALAENDNRFVFLNTADLSNDTFAKLNKESLFVLGNTRDLSAESYGNLLTVLSLRRFVKIEFDYGFCPYRCEFGFKKFTGCREWKPLSEEFSNKRVHNIYALARKLALSTFYMSERQMLLHNQQLSDYPCQNQYVLGSCFSPKHLMKMVGYGIAPKHKDNKTWSIVDGNGGWHSEAKGVKDAILFAKAKGLDFRLIRSNDYGKFLETLSQFFGLIFLPKIHDTCPRLVIEAKLMGLKLHINDNVQHANEVWFNQVKPEDIANYLLGRPAFFKEAIKEFC